ncbi:hypothetical protein DS901_02215 [Loktanella sp. D2R18]|nr:hypothetical protein DS901_02215 [Loktanella sp. D2R18]
MVDEYDRFSELLGEVRPLKKRYVPIKYVGSLWFLALLLFARGLDEMLLAVGCVFVGLLPFMYGWDTDVKIERLEGQLDGIKAVFRRTELEIVGVADGTVDVYPASWVP